jgi:hypothetical protein
MLQAVRGLYLRHPTDTRRGRAASFPREHLLRVDSILLALLARETSIGVRSFVGQRLPILAFLRDVHEQLERGEINLFEVHQLARFTSKRLAYTDGKARDHRRRLLDVHLLKQEPSTRLRERVKEALDELSEPAPAETEAAGKADELLEADQLDSSRLFFEEMKRILFAMWEIKAEDLDEQIMEDFLQAIDQVWKVLYRIELRRRKRLTRPQMIQP